MLGGYDIGAILGEMLRTSDFVSKAQNKTFEEVNRMHEHMHRAHKKLTRQNKRRQHDDAHRTDNDVEAQIK